MAPGRELRMESRTPCKIRATARCLGRETPAAVTDISHSGVHVYLRLDIGAHVGSHMTIDTAEFGQLSGEVSWLKFPYLGMRLGRSSNTYAKIDSYLKTR